MATLWSCPKSDCPPTEIAPVDVPESGESAGAESEPPFTTDEVAALLNVPLDTIYKWHKEGTGPPGYQTHKESHYRRSDVVRWLAEQGVALAVCQSLHTNRVQGDARPVTRSTVDVGKLDVAAGLGAEAAVHVRAAARRASCSRPGHIGIIRFDWFSL
jgi:excisionase family DNA binding protein